MLEKNTHTHTQQGGVGVISRHTTYKRDRSSNININSSSSSSNSSKHAAAHKDQKALYLFPFLLLVSSTHMADRPCTLVPILLLYASGPKFSCLLVVVVCIGRLASSVQPNDAKINPS